MVKNPPANAGDPNSIPRSGRFPGEGNGNSSILAWEIPRTEEPGGLQSIGSKESDVIEHPYTSHFIVEETEAQRD